MHALTRRLAVGAAGAAAAAALAWCAPSTPEDMSLPHASRGSAAPAHPAFASSLAALPQRAGIGEPAGKLFGARSWIPPVAKVPVAPAAVPAAPPNPYRFAGRVVQDGVVRIFLANGDRVHEVKTGEELDDGYRVESVSGEQIVL